MRGYCCHHLIEVCNTDNDAGQRADQTNVTKVENGPNDMENGRIGGQLMQRRLTCRHKVDHMRKHPRMSN